MGLALLVVSTALNNVKEMGNDATGSKALTMIIKVEAPWVGEATGEDFEFFSCRMPTPDTGIDESAFGFRSARFADKGLGEDAVATV